MIRNAEPKDAKAICDIYNYYVLNTIVTFEEDMVQAEDMAERIKTVLEKYTWLVFENEGEIVGYAYAGEWKSRCSYRFSVESSVYLKHGLSGQGIGSKLYSALFKALEKTDIHAIIGGISLPNEGSIALHEKFGFEKVAQFKEVGFKFDKWIDVGYWEKIIGKVKK
ncbi:MAG: arsinothricin resistance N-acetyltransferase ArsN1 family B [Bacteroidia bacterium]